jgi:hypothetical protein
MGGTGESTDSSLGAEGLAWSAGEDGRLRPPAAGAGASEASALEVVETILTAAMIDA